MRVRPFYENVLIKVESFVEDEYNMLMGEMDNNKPDTGIILDKGSEVPSYIEIGAKVLFNKFSGRAITQKLSNYELHIMMNYRDVMGDIVDED